MRKKRGSYEPRSLCFSRQKCCQEGKTEKNQKSAEKSFPHSKLWRLWKTRLENPLRCPKLGTLAKTGSQSSTFPTLRFVENLRSDIFGRFSQNCPIFSKYRTAACSPLVLFAFVIFLRNRRILRISFFFLLPFPAPAVFLRFPFSAPLFSALFLFVLAVFLRGSLFPLAFFRFPFSLPLFSAPFPRRCFYRHSPTDGISVSAGTEEKQLSHRAIGQSGYGYIGQSGNRAMGTSGNRVIGHTKSEPVRKTAIRAGCREIGKAQTQKANTESKCIRQNQNVKTAGEFPIFPAVFRGMRKNMKWVCVCAFQAGSSLSAVCAASFPGAEPSV